jgi:hypothetical protein
MADSLQVSEKYAAASVKSQGGQGRALPLAKNPAPVTKASFMIVKVPALTLK